ncbi:WD40 repeat domain-containing protein [Kineococcus sp. SYSU DK005]|uniref:WD40 repeat domain-containing protein n=1 Tax=Kineococcus sp. SYSU DK005 TaxID=3383126 RepID=UPI003D7CE713
MSAPHRAPLLAAAAVLAAGGALAAQPAGTTGGEPVLPARLPGYSHLTGSLGDAPPGRVLAVYQQGLGVELGDVPQALAVGADGASARRVGTALERGAGDTQGDAAPMAPSPDGSTVAVGDWDTGTPGSAAPAPADVALVDAASGRTRTLAVPEAAAVLPLAWSPDSRRLAHLAPHAPAGPFERLAAPGGRLHVLDTGTGRSTAVPGADDVVSAAFSPDGAELAVQRAGGAVDVLGPDGALRRTLPAPGGLLVAGAAWSPDGRLLAVQQDRRVAFAAASGATGEAVPAPVAGEALLAWRSAREVLVQDVGASSSATAADFTVSRADLGTGALVPSTRVPTARGNYAVIGLRLATGLAARAEHVAAVPPADRGRAPLPLRAGAVLAAAGAAALAAHRLARRRGPRPPAPRPSGPARWSPAPGAAAR